MIAEFLFLDSIGNKFSFIVIGHGSNEPYLLTYNILCPQILWYLAFIIFNHFVGNIQNVLRAAIILLEFNHLHILIILLKHAGYFE